MKKHFLWMVTGNGFYVFGQWLIVVILAKYENYFGEYVGTYTLALSIVSPVYMFSCMEMRKLLATNVYGNFSSDTFFKVRRKLVLAAFLICTIIGSYYLFTKESNIFYVVMTLAGLKVIEFIDDIIFGYFQLHHRQDVVSKFMLFKIFIFLATIYFSVVFLDSLILGLVITTFLWGAINYFLITPFARKLSSQKEEESSNSNQLQLAKFALPYGILSGIVSVNQMMPRFYLKYFYDTSSVGVIGILSYFGKLGHIVSSAVSATLITRISIHYRNKDRSSIFKNTYLGACVVLVPNVILMIIVWYYGEWILKTFFNENYAAYSRELVYLLIGTTMMNLSFLFQSIIISIRHLSIHSAITMITFVIFLVTCYLFIPPLGIIGAIIAVIISNTLQFLMYFAGFTYTVSRIK